MVPGKTNVSDAAKADFDEYEREYFAQWEDTEHFHAFYGWRIDRLADREAAKHGIKRDDDSGDWVILFWYPLRTAFFDEWANRHNLYKFWEENIKDTSEAA
jgi:hypothetical protein